MNPSLEAAIKEFQPVRGNFLALEGKFEEVFSTPEPREYYAAIFSLFERYPEDDGSGVFWSALHGMEEVGGYEEQLLASYLRHPSEMTSVMLYRLKNAGVEQIGTVRLDTIEEL